MASSTFKPPISAGVAIDSTQLKKFCSWLWVVCDEYKQIDALMDSVKLNIGDPSTFKHAQWLIDETADRKIALEASITTLRNSLDAMAHGLQAIAVKFETTEALNASKVTDLKTMFDNVTKQLPGAETETPVKPTPPAKD